MANQNKLKKRIGFIPYMVYSGTTRNITCGKYNQWTEKHNIKLKRSSKAKQKTTQVIPRFIK